MIVVIADDLTGAAEIGGIGLRYKLNVEIVSQINSPVERRTDLFIVNTDTRSMAFEAAMEHLRKILNWVRQLHYSYLFKKVDSVLRGHVLAEINMQLTAMRAKRALLVPANPRLGRTIKDGKYYVHDTLIHETDFFRDPEFPVKEAEVTRMLQGTEEVRVKTCQEEFPESGIVLGETWTEGDMEMWMEKMPKETMLAGASSSFHAFLQHILRRKPMDEKVFEASYPDFKKPYLYVCGSKFEESIQRVKQWESENEPVFYIPLQKFDEWAFEKWLSLWMERMSNAALTHGKLMLAFDNQVIPTPNVEAVYLRKLMAKGVKALLNKISIKELVVEGGATAGAILEQLQILKLIPQEELAPGVIRCNIKRDPEIWITLKPGSYSWRLA